jgi:hypothetical protein
MATNGIAKPKWGALYALFAIGVGLIGLLEAVVTPGPARQTLQITVALAMFGALAVWARVNRVALDRAAAQKPVSARLAPYVVPGAPRPPAPPVMRTDVQLLGDLKSRLRQKAPAAEADLMVDAHDGVLWLSGPVESTARRSAIETLARSIKGCRGVRSYLFERSRRRASGTT